MKEILIDMAAFDDYGDYAGLAPNIYTITFIAIIGGIIIWWYLNHPVDGFKEV